nr:uncharacterized protein LOC122272519 [Parasteatoda tepidariorum]
MQEIVDSFIENFLWISDGGVWNKRTLKNLLDSGKLDIPKAELLPEQNVFAPHVIVADDAFPLEIKVMKPYPGKYLSVERRVFNYRLSRARRVVENAFGILATRFRVFQTKIQAQPIKVVKIVLAACALHNFLRYRCKYLYTPSTSLDREDLKNLQYYPSSGRSNKNMFKNFRRNQSNGTIAAKNIRNHFMEYFNGPGAVSWQRAMCDLH